MNIKQIIEDSDTRSGRLFDLFIQGLIVLSLITFTIETLPDLSSQARALLNYVEIATVVIFTAEYLLRILVADRKLRFIFSFYGLIDLLAILPFYVASGIDLRAIRVLRLFRLFRAFKLLRYTRAMQRFRHALGLIKEELVLFLVACVVLIYVASVGIYYFESTVQPEAFGSVPQCLWWAVATLTTVGYGDVYPLTAGGRIFTFVILMIGLGVIAVPAGLLATSLSETLRKEQLGEGEAGVSQAR